MFDLFNPEEARLKKRRELEERNALLDQETAEMLAEHNVSEKQLTAYLSNPEYFSKEQWETLQAERRAKEEKLRHDIHLILKLKKKSQERVQQHWIFAK